MIKKIGNKLVEPFKRSIRNKLILTMILLAIVPIAAITGLAADNSRQSMETEVIATNQSNMKWTGIYVGDQFAQLNNLIYSTLISPHLSDYLANVEEGSPSTQFTIQKNLIETLNNMFYSAGNQVIGVEMYLAEPKKMFVINASQNDIESVSIQPEPFRTMADNNQDFMVRTDEARPDQFQLIRSINRFENQDRLGYISLRIRWSMFDQTLDLLGRGDRQQVLIVGGDGKALYLPGEHNVPEPSLERIRQMDQGQGYFSTDDEYVFYNTIDPVGLRLVNIIPRSTINASALATMRFGFIVGTISAIAAIVMAVFLAWRLATPIVSLARSMQGLGLIRETEVPISNRVDEIGLLETKLNNMSLRIKEHIKNEYSITLEKKTAELKALQAQINPHFLQNTLQMIGSMLFTKQPAECYAVIRSLSEMFRYVIRDPDQLATLKSEMDHLDNYMKIQRQRFGARLQYKVQQDESALACSIPKLTLQPIVENAFFHGLDTKMGDWQLNVDVYKEESAVFIRIKDNGVGMSADRLALVRSRLNGHSGQPWTGGSRIGIQNVASRIRLHFGKEGHIGINSEPGIGTTVTVSMPLGGGVGLE
ncbi:sensor histidine kinase [Paenibacillus harenae]|uniref:sensor histidine kinase n=1 Tax=Paenibacillus harenae TaxID=306543 RepID=UPI00278E8233|nr:sensor histidine kinase [Paenibacillus harenae]MDQ0059607.1 two-component system sensor histidine kinase YesM [Paenibacillus harenae]